ncbi:MAG: hypothetical protein U5K31_06975 [Balneolaceae bacterium]|nr:hypothetical protein [Balneolaceae bacterium]
MIPPGRRKTRETDHRESVEAYRKGDTEAFYRASGRADSLRPWHPVLSYNLAAALALRGEHGRALETLAARSRLYADSAFAEDPDFAGLREHPAYRNLLAAVRAQNRTLQSSRPYATLGEEQFHAEALAWSPLDGAFLAGDIRRGRVVAFDSLGQTLREVVRLEEYGFWSAFALEVDPRDTTRLWVATSAVSEFAGWNDSLEGRSALLEVDLRKGEVTAVHELPGRHHSATWRSAWTAPSSFPTAGSPSYGAFYRGMPDWIPWFATRNSATCRVWPWTGEPARSMQPTT